MTDSTHPMRALGLGLGALILGMAGCASGPASDSSERALEGAKILDHPCGRVSVEHMSLVHQGRMDEAMKLGTPELQQKWRALPAAERNAMAGMMKAMSQSAADHSADIEDHGRLQVVGNTATLTIKKSYRDANGSGTETMTQDFSLDGASCAIAH